MEIVLLVIMIAGMILINILIGNTKIKGHHPPKPNSATDTVYPDVPDSMHPRKRY